MKCPECESQNIMELIWGYPSQELRENKNHKKFGVRKQMPYNRHRGLFFQRCRTKGKRKGKRDRL